MTTVATYIGRRIQKGVLRHCFLEGDTVIWWNKVPALTFSGAKIGTTYELGETFPSPGWWAKIAVAEAAEDKRLQWQVADRAAVEDARALKEDAAPELEMILANLRSARACLSSARRPLFDAWLLREIQR